MNDITVDFAPSSFVRNGQLDDYRLDDDLSLRVTIVNQNDRLANGILTLHALVEWLIAAETGVSVEAIDEWDEAHRDAQEPGEVEGCPYGAAHDAAMAVERLVCACVGKTWRKVEEGLT